MCFLSDEPDMTGLYINQNLKVRVQKIIEYGIEVTTRVNVNNEEKLGFIPYDNLVTNVDELYKGKELYLRYLGYHGRYVIFTEEGA